MPAIATYPQPTGGELIVNEAEYAIHGVALIGPWSQNDGAEIDTKAHEDFRDLINARTSPVPVDYYHFSEGSPLDANGGIVNAYVDGNVLRGTHLLNSKKASTPEILEDADKFTSNLCYSFEALNNDLEYKSGPNGQRIVGATGLKRFALGKECGNTLGMNKPLRGETKKMADPTTYKALEKRFPDLMAKFEEDIRAECACSAKSDVTRVEEASATALAEANDTIKKRDERIAELEAAETARVRTEEIQNEWAELMKDVDITLLPETDSGKRIASLAIIDEESIAGFALLEPAEATAKLVERADTIKNNLTVAETLRQHPVNPPVPKPVHTPVRTETAKSGTVPDVVTSAFDWS